MAPKWFLRLKGRLGLPLTLPERSQRGDSLAPHEKAQLGEAPWGRQDAQAKGRATITMRVYRAATDTWEEVK